MLVTVPFIFHYIYENVHRNQHFVRDTHLPQHVLVGNGVHGLQSINLLLHELQVSVLFNTSTIQILILILIHRFRTGFRYVFRWCPCIRLNKEEYHNSKLKRTRVDSLAYSMTIRRNTLRPEESFLKLEKKNVIMSSSPQLSVGGDDECSQKLSLLNHKCPANKQIFPLEQTRIGSQTDLNKVGDSYSPQSSLDEDDECSQNLSLLNNKLCLEIPKMNNYNADDVM